MPDSGSGGKILRRSIRTSFFLVLFLVLIGGVVRSTGAGLGCPDWPKCFGLWIPPTHISEVPLQYWNDPLSSIDGQLIFNPVKTWTEYLNRLLGVLIGFAIFIQFLFSLFSSVRIRAKLFSFLSLVLVLFQGFLGAKVVSSDLKPLVISIHLLVALLIAFSLLSTLFFSRKKEVVHLPFYRYHKTNAIVAFTSFLLVLQFFLGTEVRSQVDVLFRQFDFSHRELYVSNLDLTFIVHRSLSVLVLLMLIYQFYILGKFVEVSKISITILPLLLVFFLISSGVVLVYFNFPALVQPFHLFLGFSLLCAQFWLILHFWFSDAPVHGYS
jgi:cytochrome c oxidase assembly protein subunit 15